MAETSCNIGVIIHVYVHDTALKGTVTICVWRWETAHFSPRLLINVWVNMHIRTCSRLYVESLVGVNINSLHGFTEQLMMSLGLVLQCACIELKWCWWAFRYSDNFNGSKTIWPQRSSSVTKLSVVSFVTDEDLRGWNSLLPWKLLLRTCSSSTTL